MTRKPIPRQTVVQLIKTHGVLCQSCKNKEFEHIHHIDKDPTNNSFSNLMLLCSECHYQKHQFNSALTRNVSIRLTKPMTDKSIEFKGNVSRMGDKIHIIIPKSYHRDIEKQNLVDEFVDVEVSKEVNNNG